MWVTNQITLWWGHVLWLWGHGFWCWGHEFYDRAIAFNLKVYEHKFMNTIEAPKRSPHQGHNRKYMEVEGAYDVLLEHSLFTCELNYSLPRKQYDFRLNIHSSDISITVYEWLGRSLYNIYNVINLSGSTILKSLRIV